MASSISSRASSRVKWLVVTQETASGAEVNFGLLVVAADDRVVRALEEAVLAIVHEFSRRGSPAGRQALQLPRRCHDGCGDVIFERDFRRRHEVLAQSEGPP